MRVRNIMVIWAALLAATMTVRAGEARPVVKILEIDPAGAVIKGTVTGLAAADVSKYVVALYIKTTGPTWYVHPYHIKFTAKIEKDGSWSIEHVKRSAERELAALLVKAGAKLPMTTEELNGLGAIVMARVPYKAGLVGAAISTTQKPAVPKKRVVVRVTEINPTDGFISGVVQGLTAGENEKYVCGVMVFTDMFYVHPFLDNYTAKIAADGSFRIEHIKRGGEKSLAILLIPKDGRLPAKTGDFEVINALAKVVVPYKVGKTATGEPPAKKAAAAAGYVRFAGRDWLVKTGGPKGPGPNHFAKSCVAVSKQGSLVLSIRRENNLWQCGEVSLDDALGFGEYTWAFAGSDDLQALDVRTCLGLFVYRDDAKEIDFELSRWSDPDGKDAQFVVQPAQKETKFRFATGESKELTVSFIWKPKEVVFRCWRGAGADATTKKPIAEWTYAGKGVPPSDGLKVHLNFWLVSGAAGPANKKNAEVEIRSFQFTPLEGAKPSISVWVEQGSEVAGKVTGVSPEDVGRYKVRVYAITDRAYRQPMQDSEFRLARDGSFSTWTRAWNQIRADLVEGEKVVASATFKKGDPKPTTPPAK